MSDDRSLQIRESGWQSRTMLLGGIIGSLVGVSAAYLYVRASEEASADGSPRKLQTGEAVRLGVALTAIVRQIAELGGRN
jgi:hypothetical protein